METTNNAQIVQGIYDALGRGDLAAVLGRVDETSLWDFNVARSEVPWHAPVRGPAAIGKFLGEFMENITLEAFEPRIFDAGEEVFALVHSPTPSSAPAGASIRSSSSAGPSRTAASRACATSRTRRRSSTPGAAPRP